MLEYFKQIVCKNISKHLQFRICKFTNADKLLNHSLLFFETQTRKDCMSIFTFQIFKVFFGAFLSTQILTWWATRED